MLLSFGQWSMRFRRRNALPLQQQLGNFSKALARLAASLRAGGAPTSRRIALYVATVAARATVAVRVVAPMWRLCVAWQVGVITREHQRAPCGCSRRSRFRQGAW